MATSSLQVENETPKRSSNLPHETRGFNSVDVDSCWNGALFTHSLNSGPSTFSRKLVGFVSQRLNRQDPHFSLAMRFCMMAVPSLHISTLTDLFDCVCWTLFLTSTHTVGARRSTRSCSVLGAASLHQAQAQSGPPRVQGRRTLYCNFR